MTFCEKVEAMTKQQIEFDMPFRNLGFPTLLSILQNYQYLLN